MDNVIPIRPATAPCPDWCIYKDGVPDTGDVSGKSHDWYGPYEDNEQDGRNPQHESETVRLLEHAGFREAQVKLYGDLSGITASVYVEGETENIRSIPALLAVAYDFERAAEKIRAFAALHGDHLPEN